MVAGIGCHYTALPVSTSEGRSAAWAILMMSTPNGARATAAGYSQQFLIGLTVYIVGFFALRTLLSSTIGVDDVEQMIYAQDWRLGYNPSQPPLYTWLVLLAIKVVGVSPLAPQLVRYLILFATYWFLYLSARRIIRDPMLAIVAACSPVLIYFVGWGAHQGFTHSALVGAASAATLYALLRVIDSGSLASYAWLGVALGVGLQAKYNFGLLAGAMLTAVLWDPRTRSRLQPARLLLSLAIGALALAPSLVWLFKAFDLQAVLGSYVNYKPAESTDAGMGRLPSVWSILRSSVSFALSFLVFAVLLLPQGLRRLPRLEVSSPQDDAGCLLGRFFVAIYGLLLAAALVGVLEHVKIRWMYPILILLPLYYFYRVERTGYSAAQLRRWRWLLLGFVALTVVLWVLQPVARNLCGRCRLFEPYPALTEVIARDSGFRAGTIIAADEHIAGNIRPRFPNARIITPIYPFYVPAAPVDAQCLLVWNAKHGETIPVPLAQWAAAQTGHTLTGTEPVGFASGENRANGRPLRLAYLRIERCNGQ